MKTYDELEALAVRAAQKTAAKRGPDSYHAALAGQALGLMGVVVRERDDLAKRLAEVEAVLGGLPR